MDTLKRTPEHVESDFGESIISRDEALSLMAEAPGLGPPDLCWLQKTAVGLLGGAGEPGGYYHWTVGRDISSSAAIAAYFASLSTQAEQASFIQGLFTTSEYKIQRGFYCAYDPFSRMDIRCELCVPGGVECKALDTSGSLQDVPDNVWGNLQVASFLRYELYDPETLANGGCILRSDPVPDQAAEASLLAAVELLYRSKVLPAALEHISIDQGYGCTAEHMDVVAFAVFHHFARRQRWLPALQFFSRLAQHHAAAAVYIAASLRELGDVDQAFSTLTGAMERDPFSAQLLVATSSEFLYAEQADAAAKLARRAIRTNPSARAAWVLLARCYVKLQQYHMALLTLNVVPTPPLPRDDLDLLHTVPPPKSKLDTRPQAPPYDPEVAQVRQVASEDASLEGSKVLAYLPGAILVNKEPLDLGPYADVAPNRATRAVLGAVYCTLQEMVSGLGWDHFLAARSEVFVMHEEPPSAGQQQQAAASQADGSEHAGSTSSGRVQPDSAFDRVLEELAAQGLAEHPAELEGSSTLAAQRLAEQEAGGRAGPGGSQAQRPVSKEQYYQDRYKQSASGAAALAAAAAITTTATQSAATSPSRPAAQSPLNPAPAAAPERASSPQAPKPAATTGRPSRGRLVFITASEAQPSAPEPPEDIPEVFDLSRLQSDGTAGAAGLDLGGVSPSLWDAVFSSQNMPGRGRATASGAAAGLQLPISPASTSGRRPLGEGSSSPQQGQQGLSSAGQVQLLLQQLADSLPLHSLMSDSGSERSPCSSSSRAWELAAGPSSRQAAGRPLAEATEEQATAAAAAGGGGAGPGSSRASGSARGSPAARQPGSPAQQQALAAQQVQLRSIDVDRQAAVNGSLPDASSKRLCVRWLDELIIALWHDLQCYMEWKLLDQEVVAVKGLTHAALLLGEQPPESFQPPPGARDIRLPTLTALDWMRRGLLAERLFHDDEALLAYKAAVKTGFNMTSWLALLRMHSLSGRQDDLAACLVAAAQVMDFHLTGSGAGAADRAAVPQVVEYAVSRLVVRHGLPVVEAAAQQVAAGPAADVILQAVANARRWQVQQAEELVSTTGA